MNAEMKVSKPNEHGVRAPCITEVVAKHGRSHASVEIALCEDGRFRHGIHLCYSYGGFGCPIFEHGESSDRVQAAIIAGIEELLRRWPAPYPSEPQSVHDELRLLREQLEERLRQPCLF